MPQYAGFRRHRLGRDLFMRSACLFTWTLVVAAPAEALAETPFRQPGRLGPGILLFRLAAIRSRQKRPRNDMSTSAMRLRTLQFGGMNHVQEKFNRAGRLPGNCHPRPGGGPRHSDCRLRVEKL